MVGNRGEQTMQNYDKTTLSQLVRTNIKKYRKLKGLTAEKLAEKTGYSFQYVRDLESLKIDKTPTLEAIGKFAEALEIDIKLFFDEVEKDDTK